MSELELAQSQIAQLTTSNVLLRGEIVTLKEKLAASRRAVRFHEYGDDRTQAEIDREAKGEHDADCERDGNCR